MKRIPTSAEVWAVIRAKHNSDLVVFSSYSAPDGDQFGDPGIAVMMTEYGLNDADYPLIGAKTTWDAHHEVYSKERNENTEYWLCVPEHEDDE